MRRLALALSAFPPNDSRNIHEIERTLRKWASTRAEHSKDEVEGYKLNIQEALRTFTVAIKPVSESGASSAPPSLTLC